MKMTTVDVLDTDAVALRRPNVGPMKMEIPYALVRKIRIGTYDKLSMKMITRLIDNMRSSSGCL